MPTPNSRPCLVAFDSREDADRMKQVLSENNMRYADMGLALAIELDDT
jgi:hypothetical protein